MTKKTPNKKPATGKQPAPAKKPAAAQKPPGAAGTAQVNIQIPKLADLANGMPNTLKLAGHTQVDARATYPIGHARLSVNVRNLFGAQFNSTGFPDPAGSSLIYYYPAAGRVVSIGFESGW